MKPHERTTSTALMTAIFAGGLIALLLPAAMGGPELPPITGTTTQVVPVQTSSTPPVNLPQPTMQPVGAPNQFTQDGQIAPQPYSNLPNAFNWHPYMPGVPAGNGSNAWQQPSNSGANAWRQQSQSSYQFIPPSNQVIQVGPSYNSPYSNYQSAVGNEDPFSAWHNGGNYSNTAIRPVGPARPPTQTVQPNPTVGPITGTVTTVQPVQTNRPEHHHHRGYGFSNSTVTVVDNGTPTVDGGYYYPDYCDQSTGQDVYPSVYSDYSGFPGYIYSPGPSVTVLSDPEYPQYSTSYVPFQAPSYQVTYNQYNYYASTPQTAEDIQNGGEDAQNAVKSAYAEDSYQAAFADIEQAWSTGNIELIRKHLVDSDTKLSVLIDRKYSYSISSDDFSQITRDAMKSLDTVSFKFTRLRKAKNGEVTAYGTHIYTPASTADNGPDDTVAFDTQAAPGDNGSSDSTSTETNSTQTTSTDNESTDSSTPADTADRKVMYVSYTLRKDDGQWNIVLVDSSKNKLVPSQGDDSSDQQ